MEKRIFLATALSLLVLLLWSGLSSKSHPIVNKEVLQETTIPAQSVPNALATDRIRHELVNSAQPTMKFTQQNWDINFIEEQAAIKDLNFTAYQSSRYPLQTGLLLGDGKLVFKKASSSDKELLFVHNDGQKKISKHFTFDNSNYTIGLDIMVQNLSSQPLDTDLFLLLGELDFASAQADRQYQDITIAYKDKTLHLPGNKDSQFADPHFIGIRDRYFCLVAAPVSPGLATQAFIRKLSPQVSEVGFQLKPLVLAGGEKADFKFRIYLGPQDLRMINNVNPDWSVVMYFGFFDLIGQWVLGFLGFLYNLVHNWGLAIIILSFAFYILLYPLTAKQMRSMKAMQVLQPQIEELRLKYKDNPQKMNSELLALYRLNKVNPLGGCLPLILQLPIFFVLYQVLMRSVALKGASFLWIKDLSSPDRLFTMPFSLPFLGNEFNLLPILMALGMFVQQKISMVSTSSENAAQQKIMMIVFPILFGVLFYRMPAGLVLYWFVNSTLMLVYQLRLKVK